MPKRGRPPKPRPLNSVEEQTQRGHKGVGRPPKKKDNGSTGDGDSSHEYDEPQLPYLYLPSTAALKHWSSGAIAKISQIELTEQQRSMLPLSDTEDAPVTTAAQDDPNAPQLIQESDLRQAIKETFQLQRYINDTKQLITDQLDTLERLKPLSTDAHNQSIMVQRGKYSTKHGYTKDDHHVTMPSSSMSTTSTSTTTTSTSSNINSNSNTMILTEETDTLHANRLKKKRPLHDDDEDIDILDVHGHAAGDTQEMMSDSDGTNAPRDMIKRPTPPPKVLRLTENDDPGDDIDDQTGAMSDDSMASSSHASKRAGAGKKKGRRKGSKSQQHEDLDLDLPAPASHSASQQKKKKREEDTPKVHYIGPNVFWAAMESYFRALNELDLELVTPKGEEFYTKSFERLAKSGHHLPRQPSRLPHSSSSDNLEDMASSDALSSDLYMGDLSIRLLSCMIEENILTTTSTAASSVSGAVSTNSAAANKSPNNKSLLLPTEAPSSAFNPTVQASLETRIMHELRALGLYDDYTATSTSASREDDEICAEMRYLQTQLRDQINANNALKSQAYYSAKMLISKQDTSRKKKQQLLNAEKNYQKLMKRDKKKKKLKTIA
ncbi:hypothetical protein SAMD00019534_050170 [Acytostelium subglobosum LB1]|uniref:hypothetical protein n=1 Tax=Acytostelium subglobosum LB1 TaxID=1410327 RepID=UPI000644F19D|nr:hypothetical protein SAMD00019534_050170 [Acytostelium subglobosum LB1]GAM21842.1 hypothetical protein SAMD00019534_050170 [Acytostelium subglobosum LB1]|eukprot:XP_012754942.1 hypothetical protein SAMD00019534_050170 [Acytostelium subglobosum LB1]